MTRLAHAQRGERAFERLCRRYLGGVHRYALVVLQDRRAAEEVTRTASPSMAQIHRPLYCHEAELAVSRHVDGCLPRPERRALRRHLRDCDDCTAFARSQRSQRSAWEALAAFPVPESLQATPDGPADYSGEKTG